MTWLVVVLLFLRREKAAPAGAEQPRALFHPPYFTRNSIPEAVLLGVQLAQPRSSASSRSLVRKLGAAALFIKIS